MVWKNAKALFLFNHKSLTILAGCIVVWAVPTMADELLWRATSDEKPEKVPAYKGAQNPFPQFERPTYLFEEAEEKVDPSIEAARQTAAQLRELIRRGDFATPKIYRVEISGFLHGPAGPEVLISKVWYSEGDQVQVPSEKTDQFTNLMRELKSLDEDQHRTLEQEVESQLQNRQTFQLNIQDINKETVILTDYRGRRYSVENVKPADR